jgi:2',3'-cyclic-nucleotide 2'-phosphodiesterase (5'-nucleotidase family)
VRCRDTAALVLSVFFCASCASTHDAQPPPHRETRGASEDAVLAPQAPPTARLEAVDDSVSPAEDVTALLAPHAVAVEARARRVVGTLAGPLDRGEKNATESTLGNFASDAMRSETSSVVGRRIDVCFQNMGGLRRNLDAGPITEGDLVEVMPFDNSVVVFELDGAALAALLDRVSERRDPVSGARFRREGRSAKDINVGSAPLDPQETYVVCTNDYVFEGGGDYPLKPAANVVYTGVLVRDTFISALEDAAREGRSIAPTVDGRVSE